MLHINNGSPGYPKNDLKILFMFGVPNDGMVKFVGDTSTGQEYVIDGNVEFNKYWNTIPRENLQTVIVGRKQHINLPDVCFSCIAEYDNMEESIKTIKENIGQISSNNKIIIINRPINLIKCRRSNIYEKFHHLKGMTIPKVMCIEANKVQDVIDRVNELDFKAPFIIRPVGTHTGCGVIKIEDVDKQRDLLEIYAFNNSKFYITKYHDFVSDDGLYRKCRIVVINGKLHVRHLIIDDQWMIHSNSRYNIMPESKKLLEEEKAFLEAFPNQLNKDVIDSISVIHEELGLDVFGIDCNIKDDGSILVFEINPCMKILDQDKMHINPYLEKYVKEIRTAIETMVIEKAKDI